MAIVNTIPGETFLFALYAAQHVMIDMTITSEDLRRLRRWEGGKNGDTRAAHFKSLKAWILRDGDGKLHVECNEHFDDVEEEDAAASEDDRQTGHEFEQIKMGEWIWRSAL